MKLKNIGYTGIGASSSSGVPSTIDNIHCDNGNDPRLADIHVDSDPDTTIHTNANVPDSPVPTTTLANTSTCLGSVSDNAAPPERSNTSSVSAAYSGKPTQDQMNRAINEYWKLHSITPKRFHEEVKRLQQVIDNHC